MVRSQHNGLVFFHISSSNIWSDSLFIDVPSYVPEALAALSKHSFEQRASLSVREIVKMCCSEFKRTHTDDWLSHKKKFTLTQLEALEDVVSTPHYYA